MNLEERIELHEQWLLSMESNHSQMAADLATLKDTVASTARQQEQLTGLVVTLGQNQNVLFLSMSSLTTQLLQNAANVDRLTTNLDRLTTNLDGLTADVRKLEETVDRYIRFGGNGRPEG